MKFRILFLLTLVVVGSQSSRAHASTCTNSTIRGSYAFTIRGTLFLPDGVVTENYVQQFSTQCNIVAV
jgi:hypothetical protein